MKNNVSKNEFIQAFDDYGRGDSFTTAGREALYDWFVDLEEDCGQEIELDVVAIDCEYAEYETLEEIVDCYDTLFDSESTVEDIQDHTMVIPIPSGGFIIQQF